MVGSLPVSALWTYTASCTLRLSSRESRFAFVSASSVESLIFIPSMFFITEFCVLWSLFLFLVLRPPHTKSP